MVASPRGVTSGGAGLRVPARSRAVSWRTVGAQVKDGLLLVDYTGRASRATARPAVDTAARRRARGGVHRRGGRRRCGRRRDRDRLRLRRDRLRLRRDRLRLRKKACYIRVTMSAMPAHSPACSSIRCRVDLDFAPPGAVAICGLLCLLLRQARAH